MAYRGRLLVELESRLGEEIDKELEVMKPPELIRVQVKETFSNLFYVRKAIKIYLAKQSDIMHTNMQLVLKLTIFVFIMV